MGLFWQTQAERSGVADARVGEWEAQTLNARGACVTGAMVWVDLQQEKERSRFKDVDE